MWHDITRTTPGINMDACRNDVGDYIMPKYTIDFTLERYGEAVIEADSMEEAKKEFMREANVSILYLHRKTYDYGVKINWSHENNENSTS